LEVIFYKKK